MSRRPAPRVSAFGAGLMTLALLAVALYAVFSPHVPGLPHTEIRAVFSSSNELAKNAPVRIAGVNVGKVTGVQRGPGDAATVTMRIDDRGLPVHTDATAVIRPRIILEGNFFVDLQPGTPGAPTLRDGGTIPLGQTRVPVQLDQVISTLDSSTRTQAQTLLREYARALSHGGARAVHDALRPAPGAFAGVAVTAQAARGVRADDLAVALRDSGRLTAALASQRTALERLVPAYARTISALAGGRQALARAAGAAAVLLRALPAQARAIDAVLPPVRRAAAQLGPALAGLPAFTADAVPALAQLRGLLAPAEARGLVHDLRPALRSLRRTQPRLRALFPPVTAVTRCVRDVIVPTLQETVPDGRLTVDQPVWQELLHLATSLGSASQNFDGNGPSARFHAGYGEGAVSLGDNPNVGEVFATQAFTGSRPAWLGPGKEPPFRPDAPCTAERPPDLHADTLGAPPQRRVSLSPSPSQLASVLRAWHAITRRVAR